MSLFHDLANTASIEVCKIGKTPVRFSPFFLAFVLYIGRLLVAHTGSVQAGVISTALFMLSYLAHELTHVIVSEKHGSSEMFYIYFLGFMPTGTIPDDCKPHEYFWDKVSALVTTAFLAVCFYAASFFYGNLLDYDVFLLSAKLQLAILAFNALPFEPLDGGAFVTVPIWLWTGDREFALNIGRNIAVCFLVAFFLFSVVNFSPLPMMFSGVLLYSYWERKRNDKD